MARQFDATIKGLLEASPPDWLALAGYAGAAVELIDADVSTFTGAADKVMRVRAASDWLLHWEAQAGPDNSLPARTHLYNTILGHRHKLRVRSVILLLRPEANLSNLTGTYEVAFEEEEEEPYLTFRYRVMRLWETPVERVFAGGTGILPLAPLAAVTEADLPGVIAQIARRYNDEVPPAEAEALWTATYVLMGLRYPPPFVDQLLREVTKMEESATYQAIIAKGVAQGVAQGALEELKKTLLRQGRIAFGEPAAALRDALNSESDLGRLEELSVRLLEVNSWEELLGIPTAQG